jgi:hypothetical protein
MYSPLKYSYLDVKMKGNWTGNTVLNREVSQGDYKFGSM